MSEKKEKGFWGWVWKKTGLEVKVGEEVAKEKEEKERLLREQEESIKETIDLMSQYLLTISADTYICSKGKKPSDYDYKGVDGVYLGKRNLESAILHAKFQMIKQAKDFEAEVVVDIRPSISYHQYHYQPVYLIGTALVPKEKPEPKEEEPPADTE